MAIGTEVRVTLEDKPGSMAKVASTLGNAKVNITGFTVTGGCGRFFVDDAPKAAAALTKAGISAWTAPVLCLDLENKPGTLARVAAACAERGINVDCGYAAATTTGRATVVLTVSDLKTATEVEKHL
ncbi:MAG: ACT domain-containing protein [Planctomycetes bacterium]|nr:ACT domain-containing protein [Planctomycetota bacterium]